MYQYTQQSYVGSPQPGYLDPSQQQFQPSSSFGQQLVHQVNGSSYGYLQGQSPAYPGGSQGMYGDGGLTMAQQQVRNNPGYIAQFDPYSSIGQGWDGQSQIGQNQQSQSQSQGQYSSVAQGSGGGPNPNPHPRDYIRTHKAELEIWDAISWKQLFNTFDTLKSAWEARKRELEGRLAQLQSQMQYGGGAYMYAGQQEQGRLQEVRCDSE
jgi:hypothetical protein